MMRQSVSAGSAVASNTSLGARDLFKVLLSFLARLGMRS